MRILIATPEAVPYAKTGGLADVSGALAKEYRRLGHKASLILPLYQSVRKKFSIIRTGKAINVNVGGALLKGDIWASEKSGSPSAYFIACDSLYDRTELYGTAKGGYHDNALRFAFFSRAVPEACIALGISPDIIHANDWQTALVPLYLRDFYRSKTELRKTASIFTIHNLGYQGMFQPSEIRYTGLGWEYFTMERLEFYGMLNFMKAGLLYSDMITTVSETYAREILDAEQGFGLDGVLRKRKDFLRGILNGLDYDYWDPSKDSMIPANYDLDNIRGKSRCRKELLSVTHLQSEGRPIFGIVSRLSSQKGLDLLVGAADRIISLGANISVLGRGEEELETALLRKASERSRHMHVKIGFDEDLAHLIYAGSDFFLMPSKYEPCGLGQMIALRYGTVPVAHRTGGITDTVRDYDPSSKTATGFLFDEYSSDALLDAVKSALELYSDRKMMRKTIAGCMAERFSWNESARRYLTLYKEARKAVSI